MKPTLMIALATREINLYAQMYEMCIVYYLLINVLLQIRLACLVSKRWHLVVAGGSLLKLFN